jgi:hypothetical protein
MIQIQMTKTLSRLVSGLNIDAFVRSRRTPFAVIPAKAGIQFIHRLTKHLDPGAPVPAKAGNRGDDFLRSHQHWSIRILNSCPPRRVNFEFRPAPARYHQRVMELHRGTGSCSDDAIPYTGSGPGISCFGFGSREAKKLHHPARLQNSSEAPFEQLPAVSP